MASRPADEYQFVIIPIALGGTILTEVAGCGSSYAG
jgi:hypothetical protein